jgi:hypothetical protein
VRSRGNGAKVEQAPEKDLVGPCGRRQDRARTVGRRQDQRLGPRVEELARRRADVEALDANGVPLAADERIRNLRTQTLRFLDLGATENAAIAGRKRLRDRRCRPQNVDDDRNRSGRLFLRCESHIDMHRKYATRERWQ